MKKQGLENLQDSAERLGIYFPSSELSFIFSMCRQLAPETYVHPLSMDLPNGPLECKVHFSAKSPHCVSAYEWKQYRIPDYRDGTYGGISASELEARMKACSWRLQQQNFKLLPQIMGDLLAMSRSGEQGRLAADALALKYWLGTPVEKFVNLSPVRQKYAQVYSCRITGSHRDLRIGEVANLAAGGHPIFKPRNMDPPNLLEGDWVAFTTENTRAGSLLIIQHYPAYDLRGVLAQLPIANPEVMDRLVSSLAHGVPWPVTLTIEGKLQHYTVAADPKNSTVTLKDQQGRTVPLQPIIASSITEQKTGSKKLDNSTAKQKRNKGKRI